MGTRYTRPGFQKIARHNGIFQEKIHDTYQISGKLKEPTVCPLCSAVFHNGRWQWQEKPTGAHSHNCPACQRIHDHYPAAWVTLQSDFFLSHEDEIMNLIHNLEKREQAEHPLKRIMSTEKTNEEVVITTTDIHLARGIGEAIHNAYKGDLEFHYNPAENFLRVHWSR